MIAKNFLEVKLFYCGKAVTNFVSVPYHIIDNEPYQSIVKYIFIHGAKTGVQYSEHAYYDMKIK